MTEFGVSLVVPRENSPAGMRVLVAVVVGEVDLLTSPELRRVLFCALNDADELLIDLAGVDFMDATGLGALVGASARARSANGRVVLRAPSRPVRRLLEAVGPTVRLTVERR